MVTNSIIPTNFWDEPFFRNTVGFEPLFEQFNRMSNTKPQSQNYPPRNIIKVDDDNYIIELGVAGFKEDELNVTKEGDTLFIEGKTSSATETENESINYIQRGLAARSFRMQYKLADHVEVKDAKLQYGILGVYLEREVPEHEKPKSIPITVGQNPKLTQVKEE